MRIAAYVYPGWHPIPERDARVRPGFTEWQLVASCAPRFAGHAQPRVPLLGPYDDRDPVAVGRRVALAKAHGVDAFVYGVFWCRGKRVFEDALERGFLGSPEGAATPFALMWANRMPRHVLPVPNAAAPVIEGHRLVRSDVDDFVAFVDHLADRYLGRPHYLRVEGALYLSIFDSTFFVKELGPARAAAAITAARRRLRDRGLGELHLAAVDPSREWIGRMKALGFDSVTHYVLLPEWKGPLLQDYDACARRRAGEWAGYAQAAGLPYVPSVSPGWDASPRGADFGRVRPTKYPWSPVVVGEDPARFHEALVRAVRHAAASGAAEPTVFVASLNEWSEGHYLEPDVRFEHGWLEAVRAARP
jgi:hypothetical protein